MYRHVVSNLARRLAFFNQILVFCSVQRVDRYGQADSRNAKGQREEF